MFDVFYRLLGGFNNLTDRAVSFLAPIRGSRGGKNANRKKIKRDPRLVALQKKAARKRAYASRRTNRKRTQGVN